MHHSGLNALKKWRGRALADTLPEIAGLHLPVQVSHGRRGLDAPYGASLVLPQGHDEDLTGLEGLPVVEPAGGVHDGKWLSLHLPTGLVGVLAHQDEKTGKTRIAGSPGGRLNGFSLAGLLSDDDYRKHQGRRERLDRSAKELAETLAQRQLQQAQAQAATLRQSGVLVPETHLLAMTPPQARDYAAVLHHSLRAANAQASGMIDHDALQAIAPDAFHPDLDPGEQAAGLLPGLDALRYDALHRISNAHEEGAKLAFVKRFVGNAKGEGVMIRTHDDAAAHLLAHTLRKEGHTVATVTPSQVGSERDKHLLAFSPSMGMPAAQVLIHVPAMQLNSPLVRKYHVINHDAPHIPASGDLNALSQHDLLLDNNHERVMAQPQEQGNTARRKAMEPMERADWIRKTYEEPQRNDQHRISKSDYGSAPGAEGGGLADVGIGAGGVPVVDAGAAGADDAGPAYRREDTPEGAALGQLSRERYGEVNYPQGNVWMYENGRFTNTLQDAGATHALSGHVMLKNLGMIAGPPSPMSRYKYMALSGAARVQAKAGHSFAVEMSTHPTPEQLIQIRKFAARQPNACYFDFTDPATGSVIASTEGLSGLDEGLAKFRAHLAGQEATT